MTIRDLPVVDPMMVRKFTPTGYVELVGGVLIMDTYTVEDVGVVTDRLAFDADVVECSRRIFDLTNRMMMSTVAEMVLTVFPSRRWRNFRTDEYIDREPDATHPLEYLGNPIALLKSPGRGIAVWSRGGEFLIKSGVELGF